MRKHNSADARNKRRQQAAARRAMRHRVKAEHDSGFMQRRERKMEKERMMSAIRLGDNLAMLALFGTG